MQEIKPVNVLLHDIKATKGHNGHSTPLPQIESEEEQSRGVAPSGWRSHIPRWERLTMPSGRTIEKGWVVPQPLGIALIVLVSSAVIGMAGWAYRSSTADNRETRDAIIRMETMLNERTRVFDQQQAKIEAELKDERAVAQLQRERQGSLQMKMKYALKEKGIEINDE